LKKLFTPSVLIAFCSLLTLGCINDKKETLVKEQYITWSSYLGDSGRSHYSTLSQITKENVKNLKLAWTYEASDWGQMQMNPLVVDSILYGVTAALRVVALHAGTGKELWAFGGSLQTAGASSRGVAHWKKGDDSRILYVAGSDLYALHALTGKPITSFGDKGKIDLRSGMPASAKDKFVSSNTPGTIYKDLIVMPLRLSEGEDAAPGDVMAFNVLTGALEWVFHTIPHPGEKGHETWRDSTAYRSPVVGAANNWAGMAVDEDTGVIYVPTGSAAPDFYGGDRLGSNLYANSLLALNADTGDYIWHFQFTHHDIWDRDPPAPPNLLLVERNGKKIPAVAQVTKQGYVYVFNRLTGEPLFDIAEVPVPSSNIPGEEAWPTQPIPLKPKPFARMSQHLTKADISQFAEDRDSLLAYFKSADKRQYAPPALTPSLLLPGYDGAAEWGGAATDPNDGVIYINSNEMPWILKLREENSSAENMPLGAATYQNYCVSCHQTDRKGVAASGFPSLINLKLRQSKEEVATVITKGKGMMTGFPQIKENEMEALLQFLWEEETPKQMANNSGKTEVTGLSVAAGNGTKYRHAGYTKFLDSKGLPAIAPPWGSMHAIDLNTGDYIWSVVLGDTPELGEKGKGTGTENYGGPVVTENGLLFIGATRDGFFRVFDKHTGEVLWEYKLPAAAFATPAMYEVDGKQYIAIACGGEKLGTEKGSRIVAFALSP